jgi:pimeloyl-ACP methyl ester carboxylesterase
MSAQGLELILQQLGASISARDSSWQREAILSALNGFLGNYLQQRQNPLSIQMSLRQQGQSLHTDQILAQLYAGKRKLLLVLHGLCMNDLQWSRKGHNHAEKLAADLGYIPVYLHYNTGKHISENGRELALLLHNLLRQAPDISVDILAHSMGGLLSRSACHFAELEGYAWRKQVRKIVFLGSPHQGALLEKAGNWLNLLLDANPYTAPFASLGKMRSAGITDLRYGYLQDEDWQGLDRFQSRPAARQALPLPLGVDCYALAATTSATDTHLGNQLIGDGLVTVNSAWGIHPNQAALNLLFPKTHQALVYQTNHLDLLNSSCVYEKIADWLA